MFETNLELLFWFLQPLLLTILIESGIAWLCGVRERRFFLAMIWINCITNPLLCLFLLHYGEFSPLGIVVVSLEVLIVFVEWLLLVSVFPGQLLRMFYLSLAMNAASYLTGVMLYSI
jgi:hypothetical protein